MNNYDTSAYSSDLDGYDYQGSNRGGYLQQQTGLPSPRGMAEDFFGITGVNAIRAGQEYQNQLGYEGLAAQDEAQRRLEQTLAPFVGFGYGLLPEYMGTFSGSSPNVDFLTGQAGDYLSGLSGFGGLTGGLDNNALISGIDLLSRERGDLLSGLRLGQASAAQQAAGDLQTGANRADLLSQLGNTQAAAGLGIANAYGQGAQNLAGLGTTLAGAFRR